VCEAVVVENALLNDIPLGTAPASWRWSLPRGFDDRAARGRAPTTSSFANILAGPLVALAGDFADAVAPRGHLLLAGLLTTQEPRCAPPAAPPASASPRGSSTATGRSCGCAGAPSETRARDRRLGLAGLVAVSCCSRSPAGSARRSRATRLARAGPGHRDHGRHQRRAHRAGPAAGHAREGLAPGVPRADLPCPIADYTHVAVSWGEKEVFLNTPTWWDLSPITVLRIVGVGGEGLIHAAHYVRPAPSDDFRPLTSPPRNTAASPPRSSARCPRASACATTATARRTCSTTPLALHRQQHLQPVDQQHCSPPPACAPAGGPRSPAG
jgi:hypothetical protein